ncbi:MAG: ATP-binding cassette domain-containing protein [Bacteroidales bacterium]|nr:ATP-binding cassette domain-containing protein [Bacteroidales bacterium]MBN2698120.1 ATP-binding cassette domain-containing protein [Bacteroidales bacterium]
MSLLNATGIVKDFQGHRALDHVTIEVPRGSIYGLLGPNGAGKTTLLRIINQITAPDEGAILFHDHPITPEDVSRIGYLPEERGLYKKMKVGEQALYLAQLKGLSRGEAMTRLKEWFHKFELYGWWNKKVEELSKGMQQKVQFITTVIHEPELLIFDEPFSGFDPINVNLLKEEILAFKEKGSTIIFSTHNMASVEELCDHITLINKAESILHGEINSIKERYKSNQYQILFEGNPKKIEEQLSSRFKILEISENGNGKQVILQIPEGDNSNRLIGELLPLVTIKSFQEILPSMNDIFIKVVNDAS